MAQIGLFEDIDNYLEEEVCDTNAQNDDFLPLCLLLDKKDGAVHHDVLVDHEHLDVSADNFFDLLDTRDEFVHQAPCDV